MEVGGEEEEEGEGKRKSSSRNEVQPTTHTRGRNLTKYVIYD